MIGVPKVLVYGQPFNDTTGGGITLSNLFKGWPRERLAVTFVTWGNTVFNTDVCNNYYLIGKTEHKWRFPIRLFKKSFPESGIITNAEEKHTINGDSRETIRKSLSEYINPILHWLGIYHFASRIILSENQKSWIKDFGPEVLYLQVSTLEGISFANQLIDYLKIPSVVHVMDDWPTTLGGIGPFARFVRQKVNKEFVGILNKTSCSFVISDAMAEEYHRRYGKNFEPYNNPVEPEHYIKCNFEETNTTESIYRIIYTGRIGTANRQSIILFGQILGNTTINNREIKLDIFTKDFNEADLESIRKIPNVKVYPAVPHDQIPGVLTKYDLLLLPLDFTPDGIRFAKYSFPTKAAEYMLTGKPILVFAPEETAVSKFFKEHECGYCLTNNSPVAIKSALFYLLSDKVYRYKIGKNAVKVAAEKFDASKVRNRFREKLVGIAHSNDLV